MYKRQKYKFGIPDTSHKVIYERAVVPMISYGASVWAKATEYKNVRKMLESVDRAAALGITKCFRTTPTEVIQVLAGLVPLVLKIRSTALRQIHTVLGRTDLKDRIEFEQIGKHKQRWHIDSKTLITGTEFALDKLKPIYRKLGEPEKLVIYNRHPLTSNRFKTLIENPVLAYERAESTGPVSYTHLTLPTTRRV